MPRKTRAAGPPTPPPLRDPAEMTNADMRLELGQLGKSTGGNKAELQARLTAARADLTPRAPPPVPARPGSTPRPTPSPRPKPSVTMTPTELRAELRLSGLSTRGDKSDLRHRVERARRGSAAVGHTPPAVAPRPGSAAKRSPATQRSPQPGPPPVDQLSERELRVALERHGLDPVSGTEAMREQLQDHYQAQSALLSSGAPPGTTGFEARLQTLPADFGAHQQRQAAAAPRRSASAPRTRSPRALAFDDSPASFVSAADISPPPQGAAAAAAPAGPDPAHRVLADAAEDLADAAQSLVDARQDGIVRASRQALVRKNEKLFPLLAREVAAGRESIQMLTDTNRARMRERYLEGLMGKDRRQGREHDAQFAVRKAAPAVDSGEAVLLAARSEPGQIPGARVWKRPRFAEVNLIPVEQTA
eukprot:COSAG04_NODE_919_length_9421_cov_5.695130_10_plen_419_part_00